MTYIDVECDDGLSFQVLITKETIVSELISQVCKFRKSKYAGDRSRESNCVLTIPNSDLVICDNVVISDYLNDKKVNIIGFLNAQTIDKNIRIKKEIRDLSNRIAYLSTLIVNEDCGVLATEDYQKNDSSRQHLSLTHSQRVNGGNYSPSSIAGESPTPLKINTSRIGTELSEDSYNRQPTKRIRSSDLRVPGDTSSGYGQVLSNSDSNVCDTVLDIKNNVPSFVNFAQKIVQPMSESEGTHTLVPIASAYKQTSPTKASLEEQMVFKSSHPNAEIATSSTVCHNTTSSKNINILIHSDGYAPSDSQISMNPQTTELTKNVQSVENIVFLNSSQPHDKDSVDIDESDDSSSTSSDSESSSDNDSGVLSDSEDAQKQDFEDSTMKFVTQKVVEIGSNKYEATSSIRQPQNKTHDESESDSDSESDNSKNKTNNMTSTIITSQAVTSGKISSAHDDTESSSDSDSSCNDEEGVKRNLVVITKSADPLKALLINGKTPVKAPSHYLPANTSSKQTATKTGKITLSSNKNTPQRSINKNSKNIESINQTKVSSSSSSTSTSSSTSVDETSDSDIDTKNISINNNTNLSAAKSSISTPKQVNIKAIAPVVPTINMSNAKNTPKTSTRAVTVSSSKPKSNKIVTKTATAELIEPIKPNNIVSNNSVMAVSSAISVSQLQTLELNHETEPTHKSSQISTAKKYKTPVLFNSNQK